MSKAWKCYEEEWCVIGVVFADTRGKAKSLFKDMESFDNYSFCELRPYRLKKLDYLDRPNGYVMDWYKDEDRIPLVRDCGFSCYEAEKEDCELCCAKEWCSKYEELKEEEGV